MQEIGLFSTRNMGLGILSDYENSDFRTRHELAKFVRKNAVKIDADERQWGDYLFCLRDYLKKHKGAIVETHDDLYGDCFFFHAKGKKTIPWINVRNVDTNRLWKISDEYGCEDIRYFKVSASGQLVEEDPDEKNTCIEYLYRDASNYKVFNKEIVKGRITDSELNAIIGSLDMGEYFTPEQVGLPVERFSDYTSDDHLFCELHREDISFTDAKPTVNMTTSELSKNFSGVNGHWAHLTF